MSATLHPPHPEPFKDYIMWRGWMVRVIDGDTYAVTLDLGFRVLIDAEIRLKDVNTPEIVGSDRAAGIAAREFVEGLAPLGTPLMLTTRKMERSFNRYVASVSVWHEGQWKDIARLIVDAGHGRWV